MATIALIPGADGHAWSWHRVVPHLAERGHVPIPVELPNGQPIGLAGYTDAVVEAIGDRTDDLVVVAQSLGGFIGPLVCTRLPVRMLVMLNAMTPVPGESASQWWEATGQAAARAEADVRVGRDPDAPFDVEEVFFHDVPADVTSEALAAPPSDVSEILFDDPWPLPAWPDVATRFVAGSDDRFFPLMFQRRVVAERLGIEVEAIPGGHLALLSQPEAVADAIDRAVRG